MAVVRFKRKTADNWPIEELNLKEVKKERKKLKGRIMFPTTHDLVPRTVEACIVILKKC